MLIYGTIERQIFTRRKAVFRGALGRIFNVTAKDNGDGTATVWFEDGNKQVFPIIRVTFLT